MSIFGLRAHINEEKNVTFQILGWISFLVAWQIVAFVVNSNAIIPGPIAIVSSLPGLYSQDLLLKNLAFSLRLNLLAYVEAIAVALPIGFILGLYTPIGAFLRGITDSIRYIPLTAVTGIFIAWFGIYFNMKLQFLSFGIFIYLLPIVIERVAEVEDVYVQTAETLGASMWQTIRHVFLPAVLSRISASIIIITAVSWTYIIVAEGVNNEGGIGSMIYRAQRQSRLDKAFACLFVIIVVGMLQDKIFTFIDKKMWKYKYIQQEGNKQ